jgi:CBS domain-containing protein
MKTRTRARPSLALTAETAADLMSPNPVSLRAEATVGEALALFTDRGFGAAPVIDEAGRPVGVLSRTDILIHEREQGRRPSMGDGTGWDEEPTLFVRDGFSAQIVDPMPVRDLMTPVVFTVGLDTPADRVVEQMRLLKVHQLFVIDEALTLVGVISALDVVRHLRHPE